MRNLKITLEYDGENYCGWQTQHSRIKKPSIQQRLEKTLQKILQEKIKVIGSGRTDAGVHALGQVANFKTQSLLPLNKLKLALNALLPKDISVAKIEEAALTFHSRFSAKSKLYRYNILNQPYRSALLRRQTYFYSYPLNINLMRKEARCLLGRHDFKSFCASAGSSKYTVRAIKRIALKKNGPLITLEIEADGFLYNMVRNIVGTLIEIGRGKFPAGSLKKILLAKERKFAGPTIPARGLVLVKVNY